jgi:hypothetical protein
MLHAVKNRQTVYINKNGGYHFRDNNAEDIEILSSVELSEQDMHNFIWHVEPGRKLFTYSKKENFCYYKGQIYDGGTHIFICSKYQLDEDKCLKLIWNYNGGNEYGIENLELSPVYQTVATPFIPSKQDLDVIERACKEYTKSYKKVHHV